MDETRDLTDEPWDGLGIEDLIDRSSLGAPEALALRRQCPPDVREKIARHVRDHRDGSS